MSAPLAPGSTASSAVPENGFSADQQSPSGPPVRTARDVIGQAISENKLGSRMLYTISAVVVAVGLSVLAWSLAEGQPFLAMGSFLTTALFLPALNAAKKIRRENIAIRLLEVPLSQAGTATEAAEALRALYHANATEMFVRSANQASKSKQTYAEQLE